MVQQTKPFGTASSVAHPLCKLGDRACGQMVHVDEEAQLYPFDRLLDRYHFWYAFRLDRPCLGAALQETYSAVIQNKKPPLRRFFYFTCQSIREK